MRDDCAEPVPRSSEGRGPRAFATRPRPTAKIALRAAMTLFTHNLILRSERSERLEGWATDVVRVPTLRDALRAPQGEGCREGSAVLSQLLVDQLERFEREEAHVGDAVARRGLEGARELSLGADDGDAGVAGGIAVAVAGWAGGAGLGKAPRRAQAGRAPGRRRASPTARTRSGCRRASPWSRRGRRCRRGRCRRPRRP